jgi:hypothetical protein
VVTRWDGRALSQWNYRDAGTKLLSSGALEVRSGLSIHIQQMRSDALRLRPGVYVIVADGVVTRGGLQLGATDPVHRGWLATANYSSGQVGFSSGRMQAQFTLTRPGTVALAITNWGPSSIASTWLLRWVEIVRLPATPP